MQPLCSPSQYPLLFFFFLICPHSILREICSTCTPEVYDKMAQKQMRCFMIVKYKLWVVFSPLPLTQDASRQPVI